MKYKILIFISLFITQCYSQSVKEITKLAEKKASEHNFKEALELYNSAIKIDSTDYKLFCERGNINSRLDYYQNAQNDFQKALTLSPKSAEIYYDLSFFHYKLNYFEIAIDDCNAGLRLIDEKDELRNSLLTTRADCYRSIGEYQKSVEDFKVVLGNKPEEGLEANCLINMAKSLVKLNKNDEAILCLEKCTQKYPKLTVAYINLAFRLVESGNYKKAIAINDRALEMIKKTPEDKDGYVKASKKILVSDDNSQVPVIYNNRGYAKYKMGNYDEALIDVNNSIELLPDNSFAYKNRALIYLAINKNDLACQDIQKAIDLKFEAYYGEEITILKNKYCK